METRVVTMTAPGGRWAESCTVVFNGRPFTAGGAHVDPIAGFVMGYVGRDAAGLLLTCFDGTPIARLDCVSTWRTPRSFVSSTQSAYRATLDGVRYIGRGPGEGCLLRLRRAKRQ